MVSLLQGPHKQLALSIARSIAEKQLSTQQDSATLATGEAGISLLYDHISKVLPEARFDAQASLLRAIELLATEDLSTALYHGFTGVGLVAQMLQPQGSSDDPNEPIDDALLEYLNQEPFEGHFDLFFGLVGLGVYFLARLPRESAARALCLILKHIEALAEVHPEGFAWFTSPELSGHPDGFYHLGLSHGSPGVIALLGRLCAVGIEIERSKRLLRGAVSWLLAQKKVGEPFAERILHNAPPIPSRSAWCSGDPGVAIALLLAARGAGEPQWETLAIEIALNSSRLLPEKAGVKDAGLCHGSAGLAHIYHRMYLSTKDLRLREAALCWFERTLSMYDPTHGYLYWHNLGDGTIGWRPLDGFLMGSAGTALALLSAASEIEPTWDRVMLLSPI